MSWTPPPVCINTPCNNRGNPQKEGKCNSCASGKPPAPMSPPPLVEEPYTPEIQEIVSSFAAMRESALQNIDSLPEMHQVTPWLFIGDERGAGVLTPIAIREGATNAAALANMHARKITAVVCVSGYMLSHRPFESQGIAYTNALLSDGSLETKKQSEALFPVLLERALPMIRATRDAGNAVLVHCNAGINRSCSTACAILMALDGMSLAEAYTKVVSMRVICQPSFHKYLSSSEFSSLCTYLRQQHAWPTTDLAKSAIWSSPPRHQFLSSTTPTVSAPSLSTRYAFLEDGTYKNPLLGLALLQASLLGPPFASLRWDDVHFFDDSPNNCKSARVLLPSPNVHEIEQDVVKQEICLHRELSYLLAKPHPGLMCFDWGGTLESRAMTLAGGDATASILRALCDKGWLFACVSNDPNDAVEQYQKCLADAGAPKFMILANGERIHQTRLAAALRGTEGAILESVSLVLQNELGGGGGSVSSTPEMTDRPAVQWAYYYAKKLPTSFMAALAIEKINAVTVESLRGVSYPEDLSSAVKALQEDPQPFPLT